VPMTDIAGLPVAAGTAWTVLFDVARTKPGDTIFIQGGAGGVGIFAIQLARLIGLHVIATTSTGNVGLVRSLGAHEVIDYRTEDFTQKVKDAALVLDTVGGETVKRSLACVRQGGQLIGIASPPDEAAARERGVDAQFIRSNINGIRLEEIAGLVGAGKLKVIIEREFSLAEAADAMRLSESGRARGKIVLRVA
jgi:NADPH:quinone reductase-like Zn-dependent oxidoreductase